LQLSQTQLKLQRVHSFLELPKGRGEDNASK
jgi:hypothetical protein